jgi:hypothetical protein
MRIPKLILFPVLLLTTVGICSGQDVDESDPSAHYVDPWWTWDPLASDTGFFNLEQLKDPGTGIFTAEFKALRNKAGDPQLFMDHKLRYLGSIENGRYLVVQSSHDSSMDGMYEPAPYKVISVYGGEPIRSIDKAEVQAMELASDLVRLDLSGFEVFYSAKNEPEGTSAYKVTFSLLHIESGQVLELGTAAYSQWTADDTIIRESWAARDGTTWIVSFETPGFMEGFPGSHGIWVITCFHLGRLMNEIGFYYYELGDFPSAELWFSRAFFMDPSFEIAAYNTACAAALQENSSEAIIWLDHLKALDTAVARSRIKKAESDSDFNPIRKDPDFMRYMSQP